MFLRLQLLVFIVAIQGVSSLKCYYYMPDANNTLVIGTIDSSTTSGQCNNSTCTCVSYMFQCSMNDTMCTTQQQQTQAIIWNYILTDNSTCQTLIQNPLSYMNTTCCYTDLCNNQGMSATSTTVISMMTTSSPNSTSFLSFSIWIILLALIFCS